MQSQFSTQPNNYLNFPPQQHDRLLNASPGFSGDGLVPQPTGYILPPSLPSQFSAQPNQGGNFLNFPPQQPNNNLLSASPGFSGGGLFPQATGYPGHVPLIAQPTGAPTQQLTWALTKAEKKRYNDIFRSWDTQNTRFIEGTTALGVFSASGLPQNDLARIW